MVEIIFPEGVKLKPLEETVSEPRTLPDGFLNRVRSRYKILVEGEGSKYEVGVKGCSLRESFKITS